MTMALPRLLPVAFAAALIPLACARIDGEPAHSRYVFLTDVPKDDPYFTAAERLLHLEIGYSHDSLSEKGMTVQFYESVRDC